jgi:hypothetical protein
MIRLTPPGLPEQEAAALLAPHLHCPVCAVVDADAPPRLLPDSGDGSVRAECRLCGARFAYDGRHLLLSLLLNSRRDDQHEQFPAQRSLTEVPADSEIDDARLRMALDAEHIRRFGKVPPSLDGIDWERVEHELGEPGRAAPVQRIGLSIATGDYDEVALTSQLAELRRRYPAA